MQAHACKQAHKLAGTHVGAHSMHAPMGARGVACSMDATTGTCRAACSTLALVSIARVLHSTMRAVGSAVHVVLCMEFSAQSSSCVGTSDCSFSTREIMLSSI